MKTCTKCLHVKTLAEFYVRRASRDGLMSICRVCARQKTADRERLYPRDHATWLHANRDRKKTCTACETAKSMEAFEYGHRVCKACQALRRNPNLFARRQARAPLLARGLKFCKYCQQARPCSDFYPTAGRTYDRLQIMCRWCAKERSPAENRVRYERHGEKIRQRNNARRAQHRERYREAMRRWQRANPAKLRANTARRRAAESRATPAWADRIAMLAFYQEAIRRTQDTGIPHEVDHIVPLRSTVVCGLHVPANLQILTKAANRQKSNTLARAA